MYIDDLEARSRVFHFTYKSLSFATKAAKRLKKAFETEKPFVGSIKLGRALALTAQMTGYGNWDELKAAINSDSQDKIDQELSAHEISDRRKILAIRLAKLAKIHINVAERIVLEAEPTGSKAGFIRYDSGETYFVLDDLPVGVSGVEAFGPVMQKFPAILGMKCYELLTDLIDDEDEGVVVKVIPIENGRTGLIVRIYGEPVMAVCYLRGVDADLLPINYEDDLDDEEINHPNPLRPTSIDSLVVKFDIEDITDSELKLRRSLKEKIEANMYEWNDRTYPMEANEAVAKFILADMILSSLACAMSLGVDIRSGRCQLDINEDRSEMTEMGSFIEHFYNTLLEFESRYTKIEGTALREVVPFESFEITDY